MPTANPHCEVHEGQVDPGGDANGLLDKLRPRATPVGLPAQELLVDSARLTPHPYAPASYARRQHPIGVDVRP